MREKKEKERRGEEKGVRGRERMSDMPKKLCLFLNFSLPVKINFLQCQWCDQICAPTQHKNIFIHRIEEPKKTLFIYRNMTKTFHS